jgi:SAM-dependent methyltransferase
VYPFPHAQFDAAISRFGVMFFADPIAAFANVRSALRPGGRLAFVCPQRMNGDTDLGRLFGSIAGLADPAGSDGSDGSDGSTGSIGSDNDSGPGPGSLAELDRIGWILTRAGFEDIDVVPLAVPTRWGNDVEDASAFVLGWGPVRFHLAGADPAGVARVRAAVADELRRGARPDGVWLTGHFWLVKAVNPANPTNEPDW